jgi:hypothetical protein
MEEELAEQHPHSNKKKQQPTLTTRLGGGESDSDEEEEEVDDLELQKYDESEVVVNERDDLAIRMFMNK